MAHFVVESINQALLLGLKPVLTHLEGSEEGSRTCLAVAGRPAVGP